jgi:hypothetical protein
MSIIGFLTGSVFRELTGSLSRAYEAKQKALTDKDRIEAEKQIAFYEQQISLARTAAENDKWYSPRSLMGWACAAYVLKIVVYDTVLQLGVTPNPGDQVNGIVALILGFYFGSKALTDVAARLVARR